MNEPIPFQALDLPTPILQALEEKGYGYPTRVQAEAIGPLMEYDKNFNTQLVDTLRALLDEDFNWTRTAARLCRTRRSIPV